MSALNDPTSAPVAVYHQTIGPDGLKSQKFQADLEKLNADLELIAKDVAPEPSDKKPLSERVNSAFQNAIPKLTDIEKQLEDIRGKIAELEAEIAAIGNSPSLKYKEKSERFIDAEKRLKQATEEYEEINQKLDKIKAQVTSVILKKFTEQHDKIKQLKTKCFADFNHALHQGTNDYTSRGMTMVERNQLIEKREKEISEKGNLAEATFEYSSDFRALVSKFKLDPDLEATFAKIRDAAGIPFNSIWKHVVSFKSKDDTVNKCIAALKESTLRVMIEFIKNRADMLTKDPSSYQKIFDFLNSALKNPGQIDISEKIYNFRNFLLDHPIPADFAIAFEVGFHKIFKDVPGKPDGLKSAVVEAFNNLSVAPALPHRQALLAEACELGLIKKDEIEKLVREGEKIKNQLKEEMPAADRKQAFQKYNNIFALTLPYVKDQMTFTQLAFRLSIPDNDGNTLLHDLNHADVYASALKEKYLEAVKADPAKANKLMALLKLQNKDGLTPCHINLEHFRPILLVIQQAQLLELVQVEDNLGRTPLFHVVNMKVFLRVWPNIGKVEFAELLMHQDKKGQTALFDEQVLEFCQPYLAKFKDKKNRWLVRTLIAQQDKEGNTLMHHENLLQYLPRELIKTIIKDDPTIKSIKNQREQAPLSLD